MDVFASTGGFKNLTFYDAAIELVKSGCKNIEVSAGLYVENPESLLTLLKYECNLMLHNYFPPPLDSFVLNLSSDKPEILDRSISLAKAAIDISSNLSSKFYGVHSGFRINLGVEDLGRVKTRHQVVSKKKAQYIFMKTVSELGKYAAKKNILLLLENNVLTKANLKLFGMNPFLMVEPVEIQSTILNLDCEVGLLLDLAHLKISSKTLEFSPQDATLYLNPFVTGYQASENNGLEDIGSIFDESAWFIKYLDFSKAFLTMELSNYEPSSYFKLEQTLNTFI